MGLYKTRTLTTFESWKENLVYVLSQDSGFSPFLVCGATWLKSTTAFPTRGLVDDGNETPEANRQTAAQKVTKLNLMLGQIANFCPIISRNTIIKKVNINIFNMAINKIPFWISIYRRSFH